MTVFRKYALGCCLFIYAAHHGAWVGRGSAGDGVGSGDTQDMSSLLPLGCCFASAPGHLCQPGSSFPQTQRGETVEASAPEQWSRKVCVVGAGCRPGEWLISHCLPAGVQQPLPLRVGLGTGSQMPAALHLLRPLLCLTYSGS